VIYRYWDSCTILGWLKEEPDKIGECQAAMLRAKSGDLTLVTSALTLPEVLFLKGKDPVPEEDRDKVRRFFESPFVHLVELDRTVGERAQEVVWKYGVRPKDAVHVATAISTSPSMPLDQLDTFDEPLIALSGKIGNTGLKIGRPVFPQHDLTSDAVANNAGSDGSPITRASLGEEEVRP
jgi:predicted nucleic acid-binding protein